MKKSVNVDKISGEPRVFLRRVPDYLVLRFYGCFGYRSLSDEIIFRRTSITDTIKEYLDECILILFPYIRKNIQHKITLKMNDLSYIRILRNLAHNSSLILKYQGTLKSNKPYYYLINPHKYKQSSDEVIREDKVLNIPIDEKGLPVFPAALDVSLKVDFD